MRSLGSRQTLSECLNGYSPMNWATTWTITTGGVCEKPHLSGDFDSNGARDERDETNAAGML
jgi:hypothetical protein